MPYNRQIVTVDDSGGIQRIRVGPELVNVTVDLVSGPVVMELNNMHGFIKMIYTLYNLRILL
jgi:hypothetical protein